MSILDAELSMAVVGAIAVPLLVSEPIMVVPLIADPGGCIEGFTLGKRSAFFSTAGDTKPVSGQSAWGLVRELCIGVGAERSCTSSFGGRGALREVEGCLEWVLVEGVGATLEAFLAACFCCATAIGDRMSFICLSMKTGFF